MGDGLLDSNDLRAERIALRRRLLDWRDRWQVESERRLLNVCTSELSKDIDAKLAAAPVWNLFIANRLLRNEITPLVNAAARTTVEMLTRDAQGDLGAVVQHHLAVEAQLAADQTDPDLRGAATSLASSLGPLAIGAAAAGVTPLLAATTTTAMFGLVTVTTVSAPMLATGAALAGAAATLGIWQASNLKDKRIAQLRASIDRRIARNVLATDSGQAAPSVLVQLQRAIGATAEQLIHADG